MSNVSHLVLSIWVVMETWRASLVEDEARGQGMVEYALILAFVAVVAVVVLMLLGGRVVNTFNNVQNQLVNVK